MTNTDHTKPATTHTPGPWGIRQSESIMDNALLITASQDGGKTFGGHIVTQLVDPASYKRCKNFTPETQVANARLIAAAPDLLQALTIAEYWLLQRNDWHTLQFHDSKRKAADQIITTLAKATGRPS